MDALRAAVLVLKMVDLMDFLTEMNKDFVLESL